MKLISKSAISILAIVMLITGCTGCTPTQEFNSSDTSSDSSSTNEAESTAAPSFDTTGTGGTIESIESTETLITEETIETDIAATTAPIVTLTPVEKEEPTTTITEAEPGDFTVGGYASTKADSRYQYNGIKNFDDNNGIIFDTTQTEDMYNFVKAGYTSLRTEDARIKSRKGGVNNPRIAWFESYELGKDDALVKDNNDGRVGNTITVTYEKLNCDKELKDLLELPMGIDKDKDGIFETDTGNWDKLLEYDEKKADVESALCVTAEHTSITYNYRNYCGDVIFLGIRGPTVNTYSAYSNVIDTEYNRALAGVDYTLTCEDDPEAFTLISGEDLKNYYSIETKMGSSLNLFETREITNDLGTPITSCYDFSLAGVTKTNTLGAGVQFYTGVKPGIYHCIITLKDGKEIPIVIENLPIHYENLLWGCSTQQEMDVCVRYVQQSNNMLYGQYIGVKESNIVSRYNRESLNQPILLTTEPTTKNLSLAVKDFNDLKVEELDGTLIQLKNTKEAGLWWLHYTSVTSFNYQAWGTTYGSYDALDLFMNKGGDCETISAGISCVLNVMGYSTHYITEASHAYVEVKVPAELTVSGEDQWIVIDNGSTHLGPAKTLHPRVVAGTPHDYVEGWDAHWNQGIPR